MLSLATLDKFVPQLAPSRVIIVDDQEEMIDLYGKLLPQIERLFLKRGIFEYTPMQLLDYCLVGEYTMWRADRANEFQGIAITGMTDWPSGVRTFDVHHVVGTDRHFEDVAAGWDSFIEHAKAHGCTKLVGQCRPGWRRYIRHFGLNLHRLMITKEI